MPFLHRAAAPNLPISLILFLLNFAALAGPPFLPPSLPSATAAGFFSRAFSEVISWTMDAASSFGSDGFLERLGMPHDSMPAHFSREVIPCPSTVQRKSSLRMSS